MTTDSHNKLNLTINGNFIEQVNKFLYLRHKISSTNNGLTAVKHRKGLGWAVFKKNKQLLTSRRIPFHIKAHLYNIYILPVVLYGLECMNWTSSLLRRMETFQNHVMRFMTGNRLTDRVSSKELLDTTTLTPIVPIIKSKVLKLVGHVKRSKAGLSNICLEGIMEGKRKQGRPHKRWHDNIYTWSQLNLNQLNLIAKGRNQWKLYFHVSSNLVIPEKAEYDDLFIT